MVHDKPRLLDLFSGIAGFSIGLEAAGFETVAFCEQSKPCQHLLAHHYPGVPIYDDVTTLTAERLAADGVGVDAICGGPPCQDISFAGLGAGLDGSRSGLYREYIRLIRELRPKVIFLENVAALLARGLGRILGDLASIGYDAWWDCIPASAIGAPHSRDRTWIIAWDRSRAPESTAGEIARAVHEELAITNANGVRLQGFGHEKGRSWTRQQFERLVQVALQLAIPTRSGGGVHDGLSGRAHALHGLGNAVVPQIPEILARAVMRVFQWS